MARIAFVQNVYMEYLGIIYLSSLLKSRGNEVEVFIGRNIRRLANEIRSFNPDIVAFSCTSAVHQIALEVARAIKLCTKAITVFGGVYPTFSPEIIKEGAVDVVCIGEGEGALSDLADAVNMKTGIGKIFNCWIKQEGQIIKNDLRPLIEDLDSLPFPDRSIYYHKYPFMNRSQKVFIAGRGCPYKCTYCFNESMQKLYKGKGKYARLRSVENVISEIDQTRREYRVKTVYMIDDTFIINKIWLFKFLERYRQKIGLPFICLIRADLINEEVVKRLRLANCYSVFFGIESGDEHLRNLILGKRITNQQIKETARLLKKYKIRFRTCNMLGIPGESIDQAFKTIELNIEIKTDYPWCYILQPYPKTTIREYAGKSGMLKDGAIPEYFFKSSILNLPHIKELSNLQKLFYWSVKFPFLKPLVKNLIKLPSNLIFEIFFLAGYAYSYYKSERLSFMEVLRIGWRNALSFLFSEKTGEA